MSTARDKDDNNTHERVGVEEGEMDLATIIHDTSSAPIATDQKPVSAFGWGLAVLIGIALWGLIALLLSA